MLDYLNYGRGDAGLGILLKAFRTLYPYLFFIARQNRIRDPFDPRVVEAYWIGNELLERAGKKEFYTHLRDEHAIPKLIGRNDFSMIEAKIVHGALPHHSFHVCNIWKRTGNESSAHTLESMDSCRISWGRIRNIDGPALFVETEPLAISQNRLMLGEGVIKKIIRPLDSPQHIDECAVGDTISIHWNIPCEVLTSRQVQNVRAYTLQSIRFANQHYS
ncbi:MAG: hypothetical protein A2934_02675 [Candidatus Sungbacteria bacterium RIFCSPLOWO2_01_FULL_47_10]|uniref:Uncharacterized protein n=1 Tax=Candidatus Sungbacteria bacterium RIFCSPLOWO2_01_FULL_47_10 TaxID=1802276 RepID=A0A1G2KZD7_9BACT|nr:MAG: hypothetical protein A2934_02675 [Candidatus Sungbacteria bacterium RIFCSPLOWO2_01_FULL_47_10]